jgi:hypothetical protein
MRNLWKFNRVLWFCITESCSTEIQSTGLQVAISGQRATTSFVVARLPGANDTRSYPLHCLLGIIVFNIS